MIKPNFFIVGAPKCGTSALYTYLRQHPEIYMPDTKEPHFFGKDLIFAPHYSRITDLEKYLALFTEGANVPYRGEASVWYLYSQSAAAEIKAFAPTAKIIIMLRNPVDMLYSGYFQKRYESSETAPTFEEALALEPSRKQGQHIPANTLLLDALFYRDIALYAPMVQRYLDTFARDRIHIIIHDDLQADVASVYCGTLNFLGVPTDFQPEFEIINPNKEVRSLVLRKLMVNPPTWYRTLRDAARRLVPSAVRDNVNQLIAKSNTRYTKRTPMKAETRQMLCDYFRPSVAELSDLLGRDLMHWCEGE